MLERVKIFRRLRRKYHLHVILPQISEELAMLIQKEQVRGLFVDCGSNLGQGLRYFSNQFRPEHFDYVLFEPNPHCREALLQLTDELKPASVKLNEKAISIKTSKENFYGIGAGSDSKFSEGASLSRDHNSRYKKNKDEPFLEVETIDFAEYIRSLGENYKYIIVKMDIEGVECEVLEHLLQSGAYRHLWGIICEFHGEYLEMSQRNERLRREAFIRKEFKKVGCKVLDWI